MHKYVVKYAQFLMVVMSKISERNVTYNEDLTCWSLGKQWIHIFFQFLYA